MNILFPFQRGSLYLREHPELMMTIALIIVIPIAFLVSGEQFLNAARSNEEHLEKDRLGITHDLFSAYVKTVSFAPDRMSDEMVALAKLNTDIIEFKVAKESSSSISIVASLNEKDIGTSVSDETVYHLANINQSGPIIVPYAKNGIRYWQSAQVIRSESGDTYYVYLETSLETVDALFAARIIEAYYWLIGLLAIVFVFLFRHVRLIDYAYLYRETKKANETKDLFTHTIAHELRTPLTAIRGYASMIREQTGLDEETYKRADMIEGSSERLLLIVSDLLDIARIQSGKMPVAHEPVLVSEVLRLVIEEMSQLASSKHVELKAEALQSEVTILGDQKRLHQVFTNLISNALKYTEKGKVSISLEDRRDRVEIRIKDTGMGISSENQKKLFAPFFRVESESVSKITGTGLGMWITKQLVELMNGSVGVESIRDVGTHVVVTLPAGR